MSGHIYRFAEIEVDTGQGCVRRNGEERHLRQQTFQVLVYLLEQKERLVTKDELLQNIWNGFIRGNPMRERQAATIAPGGLPATETVLPEHVTSRARDFPVARRRRRDRSTNPSLSNTGPYPG